MIVGDKWLMSNIDILFKKKIVLYGAGNYGKEAYDIISNIDGMEIYCFCETNAEEWKEKNKSDSFQNVPVKSIQEIKEEISCEDIMIIISTGSNYCSEIIHNIELLYNEINQVFTWFGFYFCVELNINDERIPKKYREIFLMRRNCRRKLSGIQENANDAYKLLENNSILVYQAGKVASSTVSRTLTNNGISNIQIHHIARYDAGKYGYHEEIDKMYGWWVKNIAKKENVKVISLVRDPIARSISTYFQHFHEGFTLSDDVLSDSILGVKNYIYKEMNQGANGYLFKWFDDEILENLNVDIFKFPFDKEKGYGIIHQENVQILLLTVEQLKENIEILESFLGVKGLQLLDSNVGSIKPYRFVYKEVLDEVEINKEILDFYYKDNTKMQHFYTEDQLNKFRTKWAGRKEKKLWIEEKKR